MTQLMYGRDGQIRFNSEEEFYTTLGFLARGDGSTSIHWEHNERSGAWGSEGRIHCYSNLDNFPEALRQAFTEGTGNVLRRVNCNAFVTCLLKIHKFVLGAVQDQKAIRETVPTDYLANFDRGRTV